MAINPHRKGGSDVPVTDGGTDASDATAALSNLGGLSTSGHAGINHSGLPGIEPAQVLQVKVFSDTTSRSTAMAIPYDNSAPTAGQTLSLIQSPTPSITPVSASSTIIAIAQGSFYGTNIAEAYLGFWLNGSGTARKGSVGFTESVFVQITLTVMDFYTAGNTNNQTWDVRFGAANDFVGTIYSNRAAGGATLGNTLPAHCYLFEVLL